MRSKQFGIKKNPLQRPNIFVVLKMLYYRLVLKSLLLILGCICCHVLTLLFCPCSLS